jgi:hypothetical protein
LSTGWTPAAESEEETMTQTQVEQLAESMFYGDMTDAMCERAVIENPDARNCEHWDWADVAELADETGNGPLDEADRGMLTRIADAYAALADRYAANHVEADDSGEQA